MSLPTLATHFKSLASDLARSLPRSTLSFDETRARRPQLAPYPTGHDLQDALAASSSLAAPARRTLVMVLVEEAQRGTSPLWSSLLVLAFAPMLHRVRADLGPRFDPDLDSAVLVAFVSAARAVRPGPFTTPALRWVAEREVLTARIAAGRLGPMTSFNEDLHSSPTLHQTEGSRALRHRPPPPPGER